MTGARSRRRCGSRVSAKVFRPNAVRRAARRAARQWLEVHGYGADPRDSAHDPSLFSGPLSIQCGGPPLVTTIRVHLPGDFPFSLPRIAVLEWVENGLPHVERDGNVCYTPGPMLLDDSRPAQIVADAIARVRAVLSDGVQGRAADALTREFASYWKGAGSGHETWWLVSGLDRSKAVFAGELRGEGSKDSVVVFADDRAHADQWADRLGRSIAPDECLPTYLLALCAGPRPPRHGQQLTVSQWLEELRSCATPVAWDDFEGWLATKQLPLVVCFSFPVEGVTVRGVAGVRLPKPRTADVKRFTRGFRSRTMTARGALRLIAHHSFTPYNMTRVDPAFLLIRGGATDLQRARVMVVGCGAVGSRVIEHLAMSGVGHLDLVDPEPLGEENVHRHVLGVDDIGHGKAERLAQLLLKRFPHLAICPHMTRIQTMVEARDDALASADLVVLATGDETLERYLNSALGPTPARVHSWVEPLGVGGHAVATAVGGAPGCFECLYERTEEGLLTSRVAFAQAGQTFAISMAGCSGTFTPFSSLDADRTAIETADLVVDLLLGRVTESCAISWRGRRTTFENAGFALSPRGKTLSPGQTEVVSGFSQTACPTCSLWPNTGREVFPDASMSTRGDAGNASA